MHRIPLPLCLALGLLCPSEAFSQDAPAAATKPPSPQQIDSAVERGIKWLKSAQNKDGSWALCFDKTKKYGKRYRDEMGPTIWAIYTLARCGVKKSDPVMKLALKYVHKQTEFLWDELGSDSASMRRSSPQRPNRTAPRFLSTYETAALVMMIDAVYSGDTKPSGKPAKPMRLSKNPLKAPSRSRIPKDVWRFLHRRVLYLTRGHRGKGKSRSTPGLQVKQGGNTRGGWGYGPGYDADLSATHFAILALRAASRVGYPVDKTAPHVWRDAALYVKRSQRANGGFGYQFRGGSVTSSMTACGVSILLICKDQMAAAGLTALPWLDASLKNGLAWLDQNFDAANNSGTDLHRSYHLFVVGRLGVLAGRREFAGKDWYACGAGLFLSTQSGEGSWNDPSELYEPLDVISTTHALLFLRVK